MTIDEAQSELLRALGGGGSVGLPGLASLHQPGGLTSSLGSALANQTRSTLGLSTGLLGGLLSGAAGIGSGLGGPLLALSPLIAGLRALFGGSQPTLPDLVKYAAPDAVNLSLGLADGGQSVGTVSYGQRGGPRLAPSITVNVNAMDSRSFSDHSETIARAVREAMLNSGALTDVVTEL